VECNILKKVDLYLDIYSIHDIYFTNYNCDIKRLNIETIIEIIINLINFLINKENDKKNDKKNEIINDKKMAIFLIDLVITLKKLEKEIDEYKKINNIQDIEEDIKDIKEKNDNNKININININNTINQNNNLDIFNDKRGSCKFHSHIDDNHIDVGSINNFDISSRTYSFFDNDESKDNIKKKLKNNNKNNK